MSRPVTSAGPAVQSPPQPGSAGRAASVFFEYSGRTALTVQGAYSGRLYRFGRPGARVEVDARDRASLATIPNLRQVR